jgi:amino acid transporter
MPASENSSAGRLLRPLQLTAVMFFTVSGGPYGLEPLLHYVGGSVGLFLIFLVPFLWSVPAILMVLELNGMMPLNGGYYQWVKTGLGLKWGFLEGWWTWMFSFVDLAIYPVLFVQYLSFFFPAIEPYRIEICLLLIWGSAALNLFGIIPVGRSSVVLGLAVLLPFLILFVRAWGSHNIAATGNIPFQLHPLGAPALAMGMFTVMWNYLGWDNASPFAEEVYQPVRSYLKSMVAAFFLIVLVYAMAIYSGTGDGINAEMLQADGFPYLGLSLGGWYLGALLSAGGMASAFGLFLSMLLSISRVPKAMADDGLLPKLLTRIHPRYNAPYVSILLCAIVVSGMVLWSFDELLIIDVTLYSSALFLEFIALIRLRIHQPETPRPFRIPLNVGGLIAMVTLPAGCLAVALYGLLSASDFHSGAAVFALAGILTGPLVWLVVRTKGSRVG